MTIGAPVSLISAGSALISSGGSVTTDVPAPAGALIIILMIPQNTGGTLSCSDKFTNNTATQAANTYTVVQTVTSGVNTAAIAYCVANIVPLASGSTISCANTAAGNIRVAAYYITGANGGVDISNSETITSGAVNNFSYSTGALATANEIVIGAFTAPASLTGVSASGFTNVNSALQTNGAYIGYQVVNSTGSVNFAPSWSSATQNNLGVVLLSFKATASGIQWPIQIASYWDVTTGTANTTSQDAPAGSLIIAMTTANGGTVPVSVTDSAGNTYTKVVNNSSGTELSAIFVCAYSPHDLPAGGTITFNFTGGGANGIMLAYCVTGANGGTDIKVQQFQSASLTTISQSTGAMVGSPELVFVSLSWVGAPSTWSESSGWRTACIPDSTFGYGTSCIITNSAGALTYNPSWTPSGAGAVDLVMASFIQTPSPPALMNQMLVFM